MKTPFLAFFVAFCCLIAPQIANAADYDVVGRKKVVRVHREAGWRYVRAGCPDRYSCAPLYGHYGPWGGERYWASYSYTWGY